MGILYYYYFYYHVILSCTRRFFYIKLYWSPPILYWNICSMVHPMFPTSILFVVHRSVSAHQLLPSVHRIPLCACDLFHPCSRRKRICLFVFWMLLKKPLTHRACSNFAFNTLADANLCETLIVDSISLYFAFISSFSARTLFNSSNKKRFSFKSFSLSRLIGPLNFIGFNGVFLAFANRSKWLRCRENSPCTSPSSTKDLWSSESLEYLKFKFILEWLVDSLLLCVVWSPPI